MFPFFFKCSSSLSNQSLKFCQEITTVEDAETVYGITYFDDVSSRMVGEETVLPGEILDYVTVNFGRLSKEQRIQLFPCLFCMAIEMDYSKELSYFVPHDLLP